MGAVRVITGLQGGQGNLVCALSVSVHAADQDRMRETPPLPPWITSAAVDGHENAHVLCPRETRLYGTESLYGDWDGAVLLPLAKDSVPSQDSQKADTI
jgi:hypothetical protein